MRQVRFGKTGLMVSEIAFGGIPIQRIPAEEAVKVVRGAISLGVNFIDTANGYTDSEEKIGLAIKDMPRESLVLASKSTARDKKGFLEHVELSLRRLGTDYIDIYQLHNVSSDSEYDAVFAEGGAFEGLMEAVSAGKVRFPAFTSHSVATALKLMRTGRFCSVQLPFNFVDEEALAEAIPLAKELDMGFIAMKPFGGGMFADAGLTLRHLMQYDDIVPDPGIERLSEIEEIVRIVEARQPLSAKDSEEIARLRETFGETWCHRCNYCQPCPQKIDISSALNVSSFMKRMPFKGVVAFAGEKMKAAASCTECRACVARCPYKLDIPVLIKQKLSAWEKYLKENATEEHA
jgi:predicted aldo/keto reductase-like oxidoreductase